jgi:adenylosuccinate lyase
MPQHDAIGRTLDALRRDIARATSDLDDLIAATRVRAQRLDEMSRHEIHEVVRASRARRSGVSR